MNFIASHRKSIIAAIAAVLVIFVDDETAQQLAAAIGTVLVYAIPNQR